MDLIDSPYQISLFVSALDDIQCRKELINLSFCWSVNIGVHVLESIGERR